MNIRKLRQKAILELIEEQPISTQDDLIKGLLDKGYEVTQATISRDIKDLGLVKRRKNGKSIYVAGEQKENKIASKYNTIFTQAAVSADYAMNTCVIKTHVGMANAACTALDALMHEEIVGTLAGDDTIFALCRTEIAAKTVCEKVKTLLGE